MAKLIMSMDGLVLKEIKLDKDRMTIGRKPHNDVQIDNLAISGEHAAILTIQKDSFIEDLGSTNGTLINGKAIQKHFLQDNDLIEIGKYKLKFVSEAVGVKPVEDFEKTMVIRPNAMKQQVPNPAPTKNQDLSGPNTIQASASKPVSQDTTAAIIQVLTGSGAGKELELVKNLTSLGKPGVQVAVITKRPQGFFITHVEGTKFPIVNGKELDSQSHPLQDHDVIEIAGVKMEFYFKNRI